MAVGTGFLRTRFQGKAKNIGLGGFPGTTLAQARKAAQDARKMIADGHDPVSRRVEVKEANRVPIFIEAAIRYVELSRPSWRNAKHAGQWESTLQTYAYPAIGDKPVDEITSSDVMELLEEIWHTKRETAGRVRQRLSAIFAYCVARGVVHERSGQSIHPESAAKGEASGEPSPSPSVYRRFPRFCARWRCPRATPRPSWPSGCWR